MHDFSLHPLACRDLAFADPELVVGQDFEVTLEVAGPGPLLRHADRHQLDSVGLAGEGGEQFDDVPGDATGVGLGDAGVEGDAHGHILAATARNPSRGRV
jgi:hypothetical protein